MKNFLNALGLVTSLSLLSACGGSDQELPATKAVVKKPEASVQVAGFDCVSVGTPLFTGMVKVAVKCFFILVDADTLLARLPVSMTGSVSTRHLTSVTLLASTDKGWQDVSGQMNFAADGKLVLKSDFKLKAGVAQVMRIAVDVPSVYDSREGNVTFNFGKPEFEYDKVAYSGVKVIGSLQPVTFAVKQAPVPALTSYLVDSEYFPAAQRFVVMSGMLSNTSAHVVEIYEGAAYLGGNFDTVGNFVDKCLSSMQITFQKNGQVHTALLYDHRVSSYNHFTISDVVLQKSESAYVEVTVDSVYCTAPEVGARLRTYLQLKFKYPELLRLESEAFIQMGVIHIPFVDGLG